MIEDPTWLSMEDFAFGELQLKPKEFGNLTLSAYFQMVRGYYRRLEDQQWEPMRWLATLQVNMNRGENDPIWQPEDLLPLRKDPPPPPPPPEPTPEETAAMFAEMDLLDQDLFGPPPIRKSN